MSNFVGDGRSVLVDVDDLRSVEEHRQRVVRSLPRPRGVQVAAADALGLVTTSPVTAAVALPAFTNSAMDGWAVIAADVAEATSDAPVQLREAGRVDAGPTGEGPAEVTTGSTVAVMTGAPVPPGADAVVPVEQTTAGDDGTIAIHVVVGPGENVRRAGEEVAVGTPLVRAGHRITPADIGVLLATGVATVDVVARPRVGIIATGDELVPAGTELQPGEIHDSNGPMLAALVTESGCDPVLGDIARDSLAGVTEALEDLVDRDVDVIVMSGGVSAGAADHVAEAIGVLGEVERAKLAMKPGMPQALGKIGRTAVVALPGNPVSTFVSFEAFVRPALRILAGRRDVVRPSVNGILEEAVSSPPGKREYVRVRLRREEGTWLARLAGGQGSHMIAALARADALAVIDEDVTEVAAGATVRLHLLVS